MPLMRPKTKNTPIAKATFEGEWIPKIALIVSIMLVAIFVTVAITPEIPALRPSLSPSTVFFPTPTN